VNNKEFDNDVDEHTLTSIGTPNSSSSNERYEIYSFF